MTDSGNEHKSLEDLVDIVDDELREHRELHNGNGLEDGHIQQEHEAEPDHINDDRSDDGADHDDEHQAEHVSEPDMEHDMEHDTEHEDAAKMSTELSHLGEDFSHDDSNMEHNDSAMYEEHSEASLEEDYMEDPLYDENSHLMDDSVADTSIHQEDASALSHPESRRGSLVSDDHGPVRRASVRTEALIHAAARDIVAHIESKHEGKQESPHPTTAIEEVDEEESFISNSQLSVASNPSFQPTHAGDSQETVVRVGRNSPGDEGGDSSSHQDEQDDVFSDHSPRSSLGSVSEAEHANKINLSPRKGKSTRLSNISHYEYNDDFIPTVRGTPRPAFRSPSSVRAIQMSSPPASVLGTPRSSRRSPLPTVSRLGSPSVSAQYSPKKTPPRFKRSTPPLVLLHVTLVPLRWGWGDVLDQARSDELSHDCKTLKDSWRQLQDRMGDTVLERGVLLPHPQNDYEVLEERLLDALELPMRRRARILDCGHYLGPTNEHSLIDESESEEDDADFQEGSKSPRASMERKLHWCSTCRSEIQFESLGLGKIFRVKIYASNGLMRAGAWEACWKEMERVDVELEPIMEREVQSELERLVLEQQEALEMRAEAEQHIVDDEEEHSELDYAADDSFMAQEETTSRSHFNGSSPASETHVDTSPVYEDRRRRDDDRLREIYGHSPPPMESQPEPETFPETHNKQPSYADMSQETPPSPSVEAFERRQERRQSHKAATLPELLLEAGKVMMQDKKNVIIVLLGLVVLMLAVRGGDKRHPHESSFQTVVKNAEAVLSSESPLQNVSIPKEVPLPILDVLEAVATESVNGFEESSLPMSLDPCSSATVTASVGIVSQVVVAETIRVVETLTETMYETATVQVTATQIAPMETTLETTMVAEEVEEAAELDAAETTIDQHVADGAAEEVVEGEEEEEEHLLEL